MSEKETQEGVFLLPWSLATISTRLFCQTPTQLCGWDEDTNKQDEPGDAD